MRDHLPGHQQELPRGAAGEANDPGPAPVRQHLPGQGRQQQACRQGQCGESGILLGPVRDERKSQDVRNLRGVRNILECQKSQGCQKSQ